ncbi:MAG: NYN domain-containing protein [bacterium]|nr:NYN domain-containing protein [bacterium]
MEDKDKAKLGYESAPNSLGSESFDNSKKVDPSTNVQGSTFLTPEASPKGEVKGSGFISLAEAAKLTGYNQDYLGQLARSGKLEAKKIGRNWVTTLAAINKINGEMAVPQSPPASDLKPQDSELSLSGLKIRDSELPGESERSESYAELRIDPDSASPEFSPSVPLNVYDPESTLTSGSSPVKGEEGPDLKQLKSVDPHKTFSALSTVKSAYAFSPKPFQATAVAFLVLAAVGMVYLNSDELSKLSYQVSSPQTLFLEKFFSRQTEQRIAGDFLNPRVSGTYTYGANFIGPRLPTTTTPVSTPTQTTVVTRTTAIQGPAGPPGPAGPAGPQGEPGPVGPAGAQASPVYQIGLVVPTAPSPVSTPAGTVGTIGGITFFGAREITTETLTVNSEFTQSGGTTTVETLSVNGNTTLGDAATDTITATGQFASNLVPATDNTYDLGSATNRFQDIYLGPASLNIYSTTGAAGAGDDYTLGNIGFSSDALTITTSNAGANTGGQINLTSAYPSGNTIAAAFNLTTSADLAADDELIQIGDNTATFVTVLGNGNVGIGDASPAALLTVGATDLFQVDSTGAIAAAKGITNTGTVTTSGGIVSINNDSDFATSINTGTSTGAVSIGGNLNTIALDSSDWNIDITGAITNATYEGLTISTSTGTLTIVDGKTLTASNTLTFTGTDSTSFAFPSASDTVVTLTATQTLTNKTFTAPIIDGATGITLSGDGAGITFSGTGNHDISASAGTLRIGSTVVIGNIQALDNTIDIGTAGTRFDKIYADEVNASTLVGTLTGGNLIAETFNINSDNATADTEDSNLSFERGSEIPNALITWDSTNDEFDFNSSLHLTGTIKADPYIIFNAATVGDTDFWISLQEDGAGDDNDTFQIGDGTTPGTNTFLTLDTSGNLTILGSGSFGGGYGDTGVTISSAGAISADGAIIGLTYNGLTITTSTGTLTIADGKTLTVSDSTTLGTNAITLAGGEVITFSATNALSLLTTGSTSVTLPTSGTLYGTATDSITSLQLLTSVSDETGSGSLVFANTPTLVTPDIGVATATSIAIGANTIDTNEWANLDGLNQTVATTSTPQFARLGVGAAADATNILTVTSASTTDLSKGINASHTGAITGTGYGGYFSKTGASTTNVGLYATATGATNNYAAIFESGNVGIGTTAPAGALHVVGQCVAEGTRIRRRRRRIGKSDESDDDYEYDDIPVENILPGDEVLSLNEQTGEFEWQMVEQTMNKGIQDSYRLETEDGKWIETTAEHPYLIDGKGWTKTTEIKPGDLVASPKPKLGIFVDNANLFYSQKKAGWKVDFSAVLKDLEQSFDIKVANYYAAIPSSKDASYKSTAAFLEKIKGLFTLRSKPLKYIKADGGIIKKGDVDLEIALDVARDIEQLDVAVVVSGDSDYIELKNYVSEKGKKIAFFGFNETISWEIRKNKHVILNNFRDSIGLADKKQAPRFELGVLLLSILYTQGVRLSRGIFWRKIKSITHTSRKQMYDLQIANTHNFVANDIVAHNTYLQAAGTAKANLDLVQLTNTINAADMDATETSLLFNQWYYDAVTPAVADAARITVGTETDWTSTASTQDSYLAFQTALDGAIIERLRIDSAGHITLEGVTSTGATGSGKFVFDTSPTLVTPVLGVATATSIAIGANTIDTNEWAFLDGLNQTVTTTSTPQFARAGIGTTADATNILTVTSASTTDLSKGINASHTGAITGTGYGGYFSKTGASTTNVGLYATASGATNNYAAIFESGNVGIGTTNPSQMLSVGSGSPFTVTSAGAITGVSLNVGTGGTITGGTVNLGGNFTNGKLSLIDAASVTRVYLSSLAGENSYFNNNGGNVGIGTTAPAELLHLVSATTNKPILRLENTTEDATGPRIYLVNNKGSASVANDVLGGIWGAGYDADPTIGIEKLIEFSADGTWAATDRPTRITFWTTSDGSATEAERLRITNAGNVGIGTTGPAYKLDVALANNSFVAIGSPTIGIGNYTGIRFGLNDGAYPGLYNKAGIVFEKTDASVRGKLHILMDNSTDDGSAILSDSIVTFQANGNVGIGTTNPTSILAVSAPSNNNQFVLVDGTDNLIILQNNGGNAGYIGIADGATTKIALDGKTNGNSYFNSGGNVGIGTTSPDSIKLDVEDDIEIGTGTTGCVRDADNTTLVGSCVSDENLKKNINFLPTGTLDKLLQLNPVTFEWRNDEYSWLNGQVGTNYGLIAQEVEQVFPEMVNTDDRGYKRVSYDIGLSMRLLTGVKELAAIGVLTGPISPQAQCVTGDTRLRRRRRRKIASSAQATSGLLANADDEYIYDEVRIDEVQVGDEILSLNEATGRMQYAPVNALMDMGVQEVYELTTASGRVIRTTANHPYLTKIS